MNYRTITISAVVSATVMVLAACGGGGSSAGGGGLRSAENLIVKVNSNGSASFFQTGPGQENWMLSALTDFLISDAVAQTEGQEARVCIYDSLNNLVECTDTTGGVAMFVLDAGTYSVCIGPGPGNPDTISGTCTGVPVSVNAVSTVTVVASCDAPQPPTRPTCAFDVLDPPGPNPVVQPISELEQGSDLDFDVTICHVPPGNPSAEHQITISGNALQVHLDHGDYLGECDGRNLNIAGNDIEGAGPPDDRGPPDGAGPPDDRGPPDGAGPPG